MAEIINLRRARKAKARAGQSAQADANRIRHGLPKAERALAAARRDLDGARLDGVRLDGAQRTGAPTDLDEPSA